MQPHPHHNSPRRSSITAGLREDIRRLQSDVAAAEGRATDSARVADRYKSRWEGGRMAMEDLEGQNRRCVSLLVSVSTCQPACSDSALRPGCLG